jgi:hypothetical protein
MPTYLYECPIHGEFEHVHSITETLEYCPICEAENESDEPTGMPREPQKVKRLIASGGGFILGSGGVGWAKDSYSK